ncbi:hypothetical protein ACIGXI_00050 [Kitasatospora aureofaciens]|uniref:hypothetical protein n=1 Tax=Kitasatospora aureofaciens TaxID=1894 RepID=UPI0037CC4F6A
MKVTHEFAEPEGFIVEDHDGPLRTGELARARAWGGRAGLTAFGRSEIVAHVHRNSEEHGRGTR